MSGVGYKEKRMLSCPDLISSNGTWNLGAEYYLAICKRTSFFHHKMRHVGVCVSPETVLERFGEELELSRLKEYTP